MNNIRPIWTPQDSIDTAQAFHLELHNAERGVPERKSRLFSVSRERKARRMDAIAVALLVVTLTILGWLFATVYAPAAKADDWTVVYAYAATYGGAVCETLDSYPSFGGIYGIADSITDDGLTYHQAGQVIAMSVMEICPRHTALVTSFAASVAGSHA
jgi:hypothetical protein